jgi:carbon monoxide dehydrogenase subunit G
MPSAAREEVAAVPAEAARTFVRDYDGWVDLFPGYQGHRMCSATVSRWTLRGDLGMFSRIVEAEVELVQQAPSVSFTIRGVSENFRGSGTFDVRPLDACRSTLALAVELHAHGPMAPMINALLASRLPGMIEAFALSLARRLELNLGAAP